MITEQYTFLFRARIAEIQYYESDRFSNSSIFSTVPKKKGVWEILPGEHLELSSSILIKPDEVPQWSRSWWYLQFLVNITEPHYKSVLDELSLMRKCRLAISWVKNKIGMGPKKVSPTIDFEQMKHFQGKAEVKNPRQLPKSRKKWQIPEYRQYIICVDLFVED